MDAHLSLQAKTFFNWITCSPPFIAFAILCYLQFIDSNWSFRSMTSSLSRNSSFLACINTRTFVDFQLGWWRLKVVFSHVLVMVVLHLVVSSKESYVVISRIGFFPYDFLFIWPLHTLLLLVTLWPVLSWSRNKFSTSLTHKEKNHHMNLQITTLFIYS